MSYSETYWRCRDCAWRSESWVGDASSSSDDAADRMVLEAYQHAGGMPGHTAYMSGYNADEWLEIGPTDWALDVALQMAPRHPEYVEKVRTVVRRARERARRFNARVLHPRH